MTDPAPKRVLILAGKLGYQTRSFADAAMNLGLEVMFGTDRCHRLEDPWADGAIALHFEKPEEAAAAVVEALCNRPPDAVLALGDRPATTAALVARSLGLLGNPPEATENCRSKLRQREIFRDAGLPSPDFFAFGIHEDLDVVLPRVSFPCVLKPLSLAASQGVVRANDAQEFRAAVRRIADLLESPELQVLRESTLDRILVESYIPGREVAIEGLLTSGELRILAIFDKPDRLEGPFFEESIYVTPSRRPSADLGALEGCCRRAVSALELVHGPVHAEFRLNERGVWPLEIAPRPIGGLCARVLRFGPERIYLEELLLRHALGLAGSDWVREEQASGVMMIPVPESGVFERVEGLEDARRVPGVTEIEITARPHDYIAAWPEGNSYLGFIFARADWPAESEAALRHAHEKLHFVFAARLPVSHAATGRFSSS